VAAEEKKRKRAKKRKREREIERRERERRVVSAGSLNHLPFDNRNSHCRRVLRVNEETHICFSPLLRYRAGHFDRVGECNARDASMTTDGFPEMTQCNISHHFRRCIRKPIFAIKITNEINWKNKTSKTLISVMQHDIFL